MEILKISKIAWLSLVLVSIAWNGFIYGQGQGKEHGDKLIDTGSIANWPRVMGCSLSPDGRYFAVGVDMQRAGGPILAIRETDGMWWKSYNGVVMCTFLKNCKRAIFKIKDSLHILKFGTSEPDSIILVRSYRYVSSQTGEWLVYQKKGGNEDLVIVNLANWSEKIIGPCESYDFNSAGTYMMLTCRSMTDSGLFENLTLVELLTGDQLVIWKGGSKEQHGSLVFDGLGQQVAFLVSNKENKDSSTSLWYYHKGMTAAEEQVAPEDPRLPKNTYIDKQLDFSGNGTWLFFSLRQKVLPIPSNVSAEIAKIDVWSYKDRYILPDQPIEGNVNLTINAAIGENGSGLKILTKGEERIETFGRTAKENQIVVSSLDTSKWKKLGGAFAYPRFYFMESLNSGKQICLNDRSRDGLHYFDFSPDGRWLVYYDDKSAQYYGLCISTGRINCISDGIRIQEPKYYNKGAGIFPISAPAGWWKGRVLLYDQYDLWAVDPAGRSPRINITNKYGAANKVELRLVEEPTSNAMRKEEYKSGDTLLFVGFKEESKENGFVRVILGANFRPKVLTMGPYLYYQASTQIPTGFDFSQGRLPFKATHANCWIVMRQTASEAPNYFLTKDWRNFRKISDVEPQKGYNWLTADLFKWTQFDGTIGQGILYKPSDFNPHKKYPVIIYFYEQMSQRLHEFPIPELMRGDLNIPWFVSRDYLVFTPDIHYQLGRTSGKSLGWWAYNAIESAVVYLTGLPYVNSQRIGLHGHSLGAMEVNYLITHSHRFAAAAEFAGPSDMISWYLSLSRVWRPDLEDYTDQLQAFVETNQPRIGATLWQTPDLYLDMSTVLRADKVSTPLLIIQNKKDGIVPWRQGLELFLALRRLQKPVWMIQYDEGTHVVSGKDALDYTVRLTQFLDYYLKGKTPPHWMTIGIPEALKGIDSGLELDNTGVKP